MKLQGHFAGGYLVSRLVVDQIIKPSSRVNRSRLLWLGSLAGLLPDLDYVWYAIQKQGIKYDSEFQHHTWITHTFPFYWLHSALIFILGKIFHHKTTQQAALVVTAATTAHLLQDTIGSGDGIMLFYPFTRRMYGIGLIGKHGKEWLEAYESSSIYWVERLLIISSIVLLVRDLLKTKS